MRNSLNKNNNKAFTLIELLIVLSVIAVLMAILLPSVYRIRNSAKNLICQSNLRQIGMAWKMYLDDNDGRFPRGVNKASLYGGVNTNGGNNRPLNPYLNIPDSSVPGPKAEIFKCPFDDMVFSSWLGNSYKGNLFLCDQTQVSNLIFDSNDILKNAVNARLPNLKLSNIDSPSHLFLAGDDYWYIIFTQNNTRYSWHTDPECANILFMDGHVQYNEICHGVYVCDEYSLLPFKELYDLARSVQLEP